MFLMLMEDIDVIKIKKTWSNICKPFYCDIGYYYDTYQKKCIEDICTEGIKDKGEFLYASYLIYIFNFIILFYFYKIIK